MATLASSLSSATLSTQCVWGIYMMVYYRVLCVYLLCVSLCVLVRVCMCFWSDMLLMFYPKLPIIIIHHHQSTVTSQRTSGQLYSHPFLNSCTKELFSVTIHINTYIWIVIYKVYTYCEWWLSNCPTMTTPSYGHASIIHLNTGLYCDDIVCTSNIYYDDDVTMCQTVPVILQYTPW